MSNFWKKVVMILKAIGGTLIKLPSLVYQQFMVLLKYYESQGTTTVITSTGVTTLEVKKPISIRSIKWYGWKRDIPDNRDFVYKVAEVIQLPDSVDLRKQCSPVEDQGNLGSCTANALVGHLEFLELKNGSKLVDLSRLFLYYNERVIEGTVNSDNGAELRDGIKSLNKQGVCRESYWPYNISKFTKKPTTKCYTDDKNHVISKYERLSTLHDMKTCLASGYPFVFGFSAYESFESNEVANTGLVPIPKPNEQLLGGHACLAVGYDDTSNMMLVRNSWGTDWGIGGYFKLPYAYISNTNLASDFGLLQLLQINRYYYAM